MEHKKPNDLESAWIDDQYLEIRIINRELKEIGARELAAWLLKAADWLSEQENNKK